MIQGHMNPFLQHLQGRTLEYRDIELLRDAFQIQEKKIEQQRDTLMALRRAKELVDAKVATLENEIKQLRVLARSFSANPGRVEPPHASTSARIAQ